MGVVAGAGAVGTKKLEKVLDIVMCFHTIMLVFLLLFLIPPLDHYICPSLRDCAML